MIIVEGCDNTGKSTLVKQLCEEMPELVYVPHGPRPPVSAESYYKELVDILNRPDNSRVIVDRFLLSELVYGPILRDKVILDEKQLSYINKLLTIKKPFIIICNRPTSRILETFSERDQLDGVRNKVEDIQVKFYETFLEYKRNIRDMWFYDFENPNSADLPLLIKDYLRRNRPYER